MSVELESLLSQLPEHAADIKINLGRVLAEEGSPGLSRSEILAVALACAYACRCQSLADALEGQADGLAEAETRAAKAAAALMAMNNVYYRFVHLCGDEEFGQMPAGLRMRAIGDPGVPKRLFEMLSLAVSAINGCGACMQSHTRKLAQEGTGKNAIQSVARLAAVVNAAAVSLWIGEKDNAAQASGDPL